MTNKKFRNVQALRVRNYRGLESYDLAPKESGVTLIGGPNATGKTSLCSALPALIKGKAACPKDPVMHGEDEAQIEAQIADLLITRTWPDASDPGKTKLEVRKGGDKIASAQTALDRIAPSFLDPDDLLKEKPIELTRMVLGMVELPRPLTAFDEDEKRLGDERRDADRDAGKARHEQSRLAALAEGAPDSKVSVVELADKLESLRSDLRSRQEAEAKLSDANSAHVAAGTELERAREALQRAEDAAKLAEESVANAQQALDEAPSVSDEEIADVRQQIASADEMNALREKADQADEQRQKAEGFEAAKREAEGKLRTLRAERVAMLKDATFPVDGMGYDADRGVLTIGEVPWDETNTASRMTAAFLLCVSQLKEDGLGTMIWRNGNALDRASLEALDKLCDDHGVQVFAEWVDASGRGEAWEGRPFEADMGALAADRVEFGDGEPDPEPEDGQEPVEA